VTATFEINQYTVNYTAGANGTLTGIAAQTIEHGSNASTVTAVPNVGYSFVSWSDGVLTAARTDSNIVANLSITATFAINQYAVNYTAGTNGTLTGSASQTIDHGSNASTVTAVPNTGYSFVSWSDGVLTAARTDTNLVANLSVTATFAMDPYNAWINSFALITNPADREPNADPDRDGLANSIEFVTGDNPSLPTAGNVITSTVGATNVVFQFDRVKAAGTAGFVSNVELSGDLASSSWATADAGMISIADNGVVETVTVTVSRPLTGRLFARLRVTAP
jgi:hypothetical protein